MSLVGFSLISAEHSNSGMADYQEYKPFRIVSVLQGSKAIAIACVYDASKLEKLPENAD